jgi:endoglucanase
MKSTLRHWGIGLVWTLAAGAFAAGFAPCTAAADDLAADQGPGRYPPGSQVDRHGALRVIDRQLCDRTGKPVLLRGISTHDLKQFPQFTSRAGIRSLVRDWHVTVLRPALYVTSYRGDRSLEEQVDRFVDACEENGIYCIIDWHVLFERNPQATQEEARAFFARKAASYRRKAHVLYEICNEPNGPGVTWKDNVKPYAEAVIPVIRAQAPEAVIIVGTPTWSQDVDDAAEDPLPFENVMYAVHFYAGTHSVALREKIRAALPRIALFCSEWGTTLASGDGGPYPAETKLWLDFIENNGISWCNWSLSDAAEDSALFNPGTSGDGDWRDSDLTESGRLVKARLAQEPRWRP